MSSSGEPTEQSPATGPVEKAAALSTVVEESVEDLYESAPCGYLSTSPDGRIVKVNGTLLRWLGYRAEQLVGRLHVADLLTVGGRLYHETHVMPLLLMQGDVDGIALELQAADGARLPVLVSSTLKKDATGRPLLVRTTVTDARDRRSYERELLRARKEAEEARAEVERDRARLRDVLATLQRSLLPPSLPDVPGLDVVAHYHTASPYDLGGDFYDLFPLGDGRWGFFLGDVCGKGAEAATVTSLTRYTLRAAALHDPDPTDMLSTLNTALYEHYARGDLHSCCTAIVGVLTGRADAYEVALASGGHPPALVLRGDGSSTRLSTPGGLLVGVVPRAPFVTATGTLRPGDTLLLYTDGLTEARTGTGPEDRFGEARLHAFLADRAPATADQLVTALAGLLGGLGQGVADDAAVLALGMPRTVR